MCSKADTSPLRVLMWSPKGSGTHYYGPGSFFYRMYSRAERGRFRITLAHALPAQQRHDLFHEQCFIGSGSPYRSSRIAGYFAVRQFLRHARRFLDERYREFDVLHGLSGFEPIVDPAYHAQKLGLPSIVFLANYRVDLSDKAGLHGWLRIGSRRRAKAAQLSGVVAMSQAMYDDLVQHGFPPQRIARIPMGVDMNRFRPLADELERRAAREQYGWRDLPTLIFVGSVIPRKQPHLLVEAVGLLRQRGVECQLVLVGPPQQPGYVKQMKGRITELGIADLVIWSGFVEDPAPLLRAADLYSLPSQSEGMPAAVVEAMACGLPSLATPISGITDLIDDDHNGRIIKPDPEYIADTIESYLRDESLRAEHGRLARQRVEARYSTEFVLNAYEKLFRTVIAGRPAADWESYGEQRVNATHPRGRASSDSG